MSTDTTFLSVILPLKIEWEPLYSLPDGHVAVGQRVSVMFAGKKYIGVVSRTHITPEIDPKKILPICSIESAMDPILESEITLWRKVAEYYLCTVGEVYKAAYPSVKTGMEHAAALSREKADLRLQRKKQEILDSVSRLEERLQAKTGELERTKGEKTRARLQEDILKLRQKIGAKSALLGQADVMDDKKDEPSSPVSDARVTLSDAQTAAMQRIKDAFAQGKTALLHGITGSGKTEIYLQLALEAMARGRNVLFLVPEIAISRQLETRLHQILGEGLLIFHSAQTSAEKRNAAEAVRRNSAPYIVLGTRSSLFLPHHDLGLVIVDEEHDTSYKQEDPAPRYNARETAIMLARLMGADCILGSATPSLESLYNCSIGRYVLAELLEKYHHAEEADIEIIDTIAERRKRGMVGSFSRKLITMIEDTLAQHGQVIILRARRSYSPVLQCSGCGQIVKCSRCSVPMSLHKSSDGSQRLVCHYCGNTRPYNATCPDCSSELMPLGAGTQRIEEELHELFPDARIARLDSDTAKAAGFEKKTIQQFSDGQIDILLGTQIVAKGFDFKGLRLAVALQADGILAQQDFRADEKAVQILSQLRGRCSRRDSKGLFVIQTAQGDHPVYQALSEGTLSRSVELLKERQMFGYPPYSRVVGIILKDTNKARLDKLSKELAMKLNQNSQGLVTGPYSPANEQLGGQFIMHIRVSLKKDRQIIQAKEAIRTCVRDFEKEASYTGHINLDVDPV